MPYKALCGFEDGPPIKCDVVEHEGEFWLVPEWIVSRDETTKSPAYMIAISSLRPQDFGDSPFGDCRFVIGTPIPKSLHDGGEAPAGSDVRVIRKPPIFVPMNPN